MSVPPSTTRKNATLSAETVDRLTNDSQLANWLSQSFRFSGMLAAATFIWNIPLDRPAGLRNVEALITQDP
ncbi:MAG: hypothetical protein ACK6D4_06720 [Planctomyces sp.]